MPRAKCVEVIDGDTVRIRKGTKIRLEDVNAPELGTPAGTAAKRKLESLVKNQDIGLSIKGKSYDRVVAEVTVGGGSVNEAMRRFLKKKK